MGTWYTTRETVKSALDSNETARSDAQIDRAIEAASRRVGRLCHRAFHPTTGIRYFDWPLNGRRTSPWRLWLDQDELVSVTTLVSGGVTIPSTDYFLEPINRGAPYDRVEINLASSSAFSAGPGTYQRAIVITGVFGYPETLVPATTLTASISSTSATSCSVANVQAVGVGDTLKIDSEYLTVTAKTWATAGATLAADLLASKGQTAVTLSAPVNAGEVVQLDAEQMYVISVTGNVATVIRAFNGTALAVHTGSVAVYGARSLTVARGALGSTAATHTSTTAVSTLAFPGPVTALTVAYAIDQLEQERSGYSRMVGSGEGQMSATGGALTKLEQAVFNAYGRKRFGRAV